MQIFGKWRYWMEVDGQFQASAVLSHLSETQVPIGYKVRLTQEPVWNL
jgi:hypothetical protein